MANLGNYKFSNQGGIPKASGLYYLSDLVQEDKIGESVVYEKRSFT